MAATLFFGLRENSRTKMKLSGQKINLDQALFAMMIDYLSFLAWTKTEPAQQGQNRPESVLDALRGKKEERDHEVFESVEDFERARREILGE